LNINYPQPVSWNKYSASSLRVFESDGYYEQMLNKIIDFSELDMPTHAYVCFLQLKKEEHIGGALRYILENRPHMFELLSPDNIHNWGIFLGKVLSAGGIGGFHVS